MPQASYAHNILLRYKMNTTHLLPHHIVLLRWTHQQVVSGTSLSQAFLTTESLYPHLDVELVDLREETSDGVIYPAVVQKHKLRPASRQKSGHVLLVELINLPQIAARVLARGRTPASIHESKPRGSGEGVRR